MDHLSGSGGIRSTISGLEKHFFSIRDHLLPELQSSVAIKSLMDAVPATVISECKVLVDETFLALRKEERVRVLFEHLNSHWSFFDYNLLEHLVKKFGSQQLKNSMDGYVSSIQHFFRHTTVQQLSIACPLFQRPSNYSDMEVQISQDCSTYSVEKLNNLRDECCQKLNLTDVLIFFGVLLEADSFRVVWLLSTVHTAHLIDNMNQIDTHFLHQEGIVRIIVEQQLLYQSKEVCHRQ